MYTFFHAPGTCALASHIVLEHVGAEYRAVRIDLAKGEQRSPEYLRINPKGRVPALSTERGVLTETPAILAFLAQSYPEAELIPADDPFEFARVQAFNSFLCATVHVAHAHRLRGSRWADDPAAQEAMKKKVPQNMTDYFDMIEKQYFEGPWVMGGQYTIADPYLFTITRWLEGDGVDAKQFPKVQQHRERMEEDGAVRRVMESLAG